MAKYESKFDFTTKFEPKMDFKVEIDLFGKKSHKTVMTGSVKGGKVENGMKADSELTLINKGFDMDIKISEHVSLQLQDVAYIAKMKYHMDKAKSESEFIVKLNTKEAELKMKMFNKDLLHVNSKLQLSKDKQVVDTVMSSYGVKPLVAHLELKDLNTLIYTLAKKDTPNNKLQISSGLVLGQIADFRAEILKGKDKNNLIHASLKLDDANFMKPDFGVNVENIKKLVLVST